MDERMIRKYFLAGYAIKALTLLLAGLGIGLGLIFLFLHVPVFLENDYLQVSALTGLIGLVFLLSTLLVAPLEYRVDKKYGRTTFGFGSYLGYKLRSRLIFMVPFALLLLLFFLFAFLVPSGDMFSTPITFATSLLAILVIGLIMPRIYGSVLKKERIEDEDLLNSIRELSTKMGIRGRFTGAYHVPVQGFKVVNAAQLGFGRRQARIYLIGDVEKVLERKEIEAVVAHEFAHLKMRHILKLSLILLALMFVLYFSFTVLTELLVYYLVSSGLILTSELFFLAILVLDYLAPFMVLYLLLLKFRRIFETEADILAARTTSPRDLATALSKLAEYNLIPMRLPRIVGILKGHPSISERIDRLERMERSEEGIMMIGLS